MALKLRRTPHGADGFTVKVPATADQSLARGTLTHYDQVTDSIILAEGITTKSANSITLGTASGPEGKQTTAINLIDYNREWWLRLGGTVTAGDPIVAGTGADKGTAVKASSAEEIAASVLVVMESGVKGTVVPCQKKLD